ncbi:MAG: LptF/LptG family permease [Deltaproteobacteria bacterium]|nr:LptF/LptG family permease [Deltaproteobacteria bacterium]
MGPAIINRNILLETVPSFLVNLAVFTFILLMARIMSFADLVVTNGVSSGEIFWIFLLIMPKMLSMSIPMATLLSSLTTFLRMSADSELTVLKASGVSLHQLLPPVFFFGLTAAILTAFFTVYLTPIANLKFREEVLTLAKARADLAIKEQVFVRDFPGLTMYVGQIPMGALPMSNIVINDRRSPNENTLITAKNGQLDLDLAEGLLLFRLKNGVIDRVYSDRLSVDSVFFDTYELKISPGAEFENRENNLSLGRSELPTRDLYPEAEKLKKEDNPGWIYYVLEFHRRLSLPVAALLMPLIGMPLGASFRTRGRNFGLLMGLLIFVLYYSVFTLGWTLGGNFLLPPIPASWAASLMVLLASLYFLKNINRTASIDLGAFWRRSMRRFSSQGKART